MANRETLTGWETVTCSRCGGSGQHSYCTQCGTTCFKCGGQKRVLTARGAAAVAWLAEQRKTRVADLQVGMRVKVSGYRKPLTIQEIKQSGSYCESSNGRIYYVDLIFKPITLSVFPESTVEAVPASEDERLAQVRAAIAYQNTLTKIGKPRKVATNRVAA
jgi:hypothetical protein